MSAVSGTKGSVETGCIPGTDLPLSKSEKDGIIPLLFKKVVSFQSSYTITSVELNFTAEESDQLSADEPITHQRKFTAGFSASSFADDLLSIFDEIFNRLDARFSYPTIRCAMTTQLEKAGKCYEYSYRVACCGTVAGLNLLLHPQREALLAHEALKK